MYSARTQFSLIVRKAKFSEVIFEAVSLEYVILVALQYIKHILKNIWN